MAKRKEKPVAALETAPPKPRLPEVEQPEFGKREVAVDPPVPVRIFGRVLGMVVGAERSGPSVDINSGGGERNPLKSASRDQTMYQVRVGDAVGTYPASALEVL